MATTEPRLTSPYEESGNIDVDYYNLPIIDDSDISAGDITGYIWKYYAFDIGDNAEANRYVFDSSMTNGGGARVFYRILVSGLGPDIETTFEYLRENPEEEDSYFTAQYLLYDGTHTFINSSGRYGADSNYRYIFILFREDGIVSDIVINFKYTKCEGTYKGATLETIDYLDGQISYRLFYPLNYDHNNRSTKYPLMINLPGQTTVTHTTAVKDHPLAVFWGGESYLEDYPRFGICFHWADTGASGRGSTNQSAPTSPPTTYNGLLGDYLYVREGTWIQGGMHKAVQKIIDTFNIDTNRVYATGFSLGTVALLEFAKQNPQLLAGMIVCDGGFFPDYWTTDPYNDNFTSPEEVDGQEIFSYFQKEVKKIRHIPTTFSAQTDGYAELQMARIHNEILRQGGDSHYVLNSSNVATLENWIYDNDEILFTGDGKVLTFTIGDDSWDVEFENGIEYNALSAYVKIGNTPGDTEYLWVTYAAAKTTTLMGANPYTGEASKGTLRVRKWQSSTGYPDYAESISITSAPTATYYPFLGEDKWDIRNSSDYTEYGIVEVVNFFPFTKNVRWNCSKISDHDSGSSNVQGTVYLDWLFAQNKQNNIEPYYTTPISDDTYDGGEIRKYLGPDETVEIEENSKIKYSGRADSKITIRNVNYLIGEDGENLIWNRGGADEHIFTTVGESITTGPTGRQFNITYQGVGSYLFDVDLLAEEGFVITKNNFLVVYNLDNLDSVEFVSYYAVERGLDYISNPSTTNNGSIGGINWQVDGQLLGIQCSSNELLASEEEFNIYVLNPIKDAIANSAELQDKIIGGIILGYKVPGGFYDGEDVISSTSRVSRINYSFNKQVKNKLYDRNVFKRFDSVDADYALICSRIDGPNLQFVKKVIDNATILYKQLFANGKFYIDPYSDIQASGASDYTNLLLDFKDNMLPNLNLSTWETTFMDPYIDSTIPFVEGDSFMWSWFADRSSTSFFQNSNASRVFLYNADYDGGFTVRDENGKTWPFLAMDGGYLLTAGSMSNPTIDGFLNPKSFFYALLRGATLGEAYLFSVPYLDWTVSLFGDPIPLCSFDSDDILDEDVINEHVVWDMMSKDLAKTAANLYSKGLELKDVLNEIVDIVSGDVSGGFDSLETTLALLYPANDLYNQNKEIVWKSQLKLLVNKLFDFPTFRYYYDIDEERPSVNTYLEDHDFKVSRLLADISQDTNPISEDNLYDEGWWQFEFILNDDNPTEFTNYHFILEVSDNEDFSGILITKNSIGITNWTYEKDKEVFSNITYSGVSSSYIGRKIRYESRLDSLAGVDDYLTRGETYYFRVAQYNLETSTQYSPRVYNDIIWT